AFELLEEGEDRGVYNHTLLGTVMSNLLRNALHYTDHGQVRLVLERGGFRVEDTGMGIPPDQQERMFQPFVRGAEGRGEGLGLGLSLVRRICAHQGWTVEVQGREPRGSCFSVRLAP
ncbi:MAG TPA: sensor histidine kinase, partial [Pseudomonas sp.]|nr:sensor histidine kinase [Pseudomonas sp.]